MANSEYLLKVEHLKQYFPIKTGLFGTTPLKAVDDVSFAIRPGETLGLVGESGCGKTTVGRTLLQLYNPTAGKITFDGEVLFDSGEQYDENGRLKVDANGKPVLTDENDYVVDLHLGRIDHPQELAEDLIHTVGVVEHGLFLNMVDQVIVGDPAGPRTLINTNK